MGVSTYTQPDHTTQVGNPYKTALDDAASVHHRLAGAFAPHAQSTPDMTVRLDAGLIPQWQAKPLEVSAQSTATITAPVSNSRKDIIYIDALTGAVGVATGTPGASPSDPAIPAGKIAVARVTLTSAATAISNSMIDDLRALQFLGMGTASGLDYDTDTALAANSDSRLATQKAAKAYVDAAVAAAASSADIDALQQEVCLLYLMQAITSAGAAGTYPAGGYDAFNADTIGANSINHAYDAVNKLYSNYSSTTVSTAATVSNSGGGANNTVIDRSYSVTNSKSITSIGVNSSVSGSLDVKIMLRNSAGNYTCVYSQTVSHGGGGWQDFTLTTPYAVPASGSYNIAVYAAASLSNGAGTSNAYYAGNTAQGATQAGYTEGTGTVIVTRFGYATTTNMTLVSNALTTLAAVSSVSAEVLYKAIDASTINVDFTLEVTANGGTNWTAVTLTDTGATVNGFKVLWGAAAGLTSGASVKYRLKTLNTKAQQVKGVALLAK